HRVASPTNLPAKEAYRGFVLVPRLEWTVPEPYDLETVGIERADIEANLDLWSTLVDRPSLQEEVADAQGFVPWYEPMHRLLGNPELIQGGYAPPPRLLLQVDSDCVRDDADYPRTGMMWGDGGRIYYHIDPDDLATQNFGAAWAYVEMS